MFNQPNHGLMTPQMIQMQRLMASRAMQQRNGSFLGDMQQQMSSTTGDLNERRYPLGWAHHQRNFGLALQQQNLFAGSSGLIGSNQTLKTVSGVGNGNFVGSAGIQMSVFKCPECSIIKNSSEELEIHIKTEHLNWLPFVCPLCNANRASDIQMREHIHSFHKKDENRYFYHDNPQAKKVLQQLMDKALFGASQQVRQNAYRHSIGSDVIQRMQSTQPPSKRARIETDFGNKEKDQQQHNGRSKRSGDDSQVQQNQQSSIDTNLSGNHSNTKLKERQHDIDEETNAQLNNIFGRNLKSEFDMSALDADNTSSHQPLLLPNEEDDLPDDNSHQLDALQNVAKLFSANGGIDRGNMRGLFGSTNGPFRQKRIVRNRPGPIRPKRVRTSKKRLLGVCARCNRPITAGARQMHMFFHLGKDSNTFRFRCKHVGCDIEHYRKDQMENHQSKVHGCVDLNMMEDRSQELFNDVQKLSMELLGTVGNTPGPTAAKAQVLYDQQMCEAETSMKRRRYVFPISFKSQERNTSKVQATNHVPIVDSANRKLEDLECRLCHKNIMSRIRGFHILWHLNNDLGIVRYGCKYCNFKHDRPQSIVAHGVREHGDVGDVCEDLLYNYESELKSMSKACFGVERLFEKEIRRRSRMEHTGTNSEQSPHSSAFDDDDNSQIGSEPMKKANSTVINNAQIATLKVPLKAENTDRSWSCTPKEPAKKRRSLRRFGTRARRGKSRKQKEGMVKFRELSMRLGGAQYFKKKTCESVLCEKCGKMITNRVSDHAYSHLEGCDLFRCPQCNLGHYSRDTIIRHVKDFHNSTDEPPLDNRLRFAQEIKDAMRECFPNQFIDAPIPTKEDIEKVKANLKLDDTVLVDEKEDQVEEEEDGGDEVKSEVAEDDDAENQLKMQEESDEEMETNNDEAGLNEEEETGNGEEEDDHIMNEDEQEEEREEDEEDRQSINDDEQEEEEREDDDPDYNDEQQEEVGDEAEQEEEEPEDYDDGGADETEENE